MRLTDQLIQELKLYSTLPRLEHRAGQLFRGLDLKDRSILDIGCGRGTFLFWCLHKGASNCLGVEPEASGSTSGSSKIFEKAIIKLECEDQIELFKGIFQEIPDSYKGQFDIILMFNVINHLDEDAYIMLRNDKSALELYKSFIKWIGDFLKPNGRMIIADCAHNNFFSDLNITNPFAKNIEWNKHQNPRTLISLLAEAGFERVRLEWSTIYPLRHFGRLFANQIVSYFRASHFILEVKKI